MIQILTRRCAPGALAVCLTAAFVAAGCGPKTNKNAIPANVTQPDKFLYDRGVAALQKERWLDAREYFNQVVANYPGSPFRADAKLGVGDTYMGEGGTENLILAANEYREFLTFYPTNPRADYAQYKLAMTHQRQMKAPQRDQTETRDALKEFDTFFQRYPASPLMPEARKSWREARDRLSEASFRVGLFYFRIRAYQGAISRFREILMEDPAYPHRDDVYFYLGEALSSAGEALSKSGQTPRGVAMRAEAVTYYDRLVKEFQVSEHLDDARKRIAELKTQ
jgi:outer membrane protein assembly factor BamD